MNVYEPLAGKDYKLVLASTSPRRKELLASARANFICVPPGVDEEFSPEKTLRENVESTALDKARAVSASYAGYPVLAADTVVALDGKVIGKPSGKQDAELILTSLSGREHIVVTGYAIVHESRNVCYQDSVVSSVRFKRISIDEIRNYISGGEPMDKAGAYAIQGGASGWVEGYEGSYTNIIGLPMENVKEAFGKLGYDLFME